MKFRTKPVVIEAVQWMGDVNEHRLRMWAPPIDQWETTFRLWVTKSHAWCELEVGDWIIAEADGDGFYPCKPDIFAATYEPVESEGGAPREPHA